jgi:filamentous hemagglutinin family protein
MSAQQAAAATQQSMNALTRTTQAIQAMQNAQTAARNLAGSAPSNVPNGLVPGGLVPDSGLAGPGVANPVTTWVGANTPTQTTSGNSTIVTIQQTQAQALLTWSSFNVGANTTLNFNQQPGWLAINKINDPSGVPSQILGQINALGQVYLINRNGIIFGWHEPSECRDAGGVGAPDQRCAGSGRVAVQQSRRAIHVLVV